MLEHPAGAADEGLLQEKLEPAVQELQKAMDELRRFVEEADLGALDRGLAGVRAAVFPFQETQALAHRLGLADWEERLQLEATLKRPWEEHWSATVHRHQGESRAVFECKRCGWELAYVQEVDSAEELEMPFSQLSCPICEGGDTKL